MITKLPEAPWASSRLLQIPLDDLAAWKRNDGDDDFERKKVPQVLQACLGHSWCGRERGQTLCRVMPTGHCQGEKSPYALAIIRCNDSMQCWWGWWSWWDYYDAGLDDAGPALLVTQLTMIIELPWQVSLAAGTVSGHRGCDGRACLMDREFPPYPPTPPPPTPEPKQNASKTPKYFIIWWRTILLNGPWVASISSLQTLTPKVSQKKTFKLETPKKVGQISTKIKIGI